MAARDPDMRRRIAALGGLGKAARHGDGLAEGRRTYRDSFRAGHECGMCPKVEIPQDLPAEEIDRRAKALFAAHMRRIRMRRMRAERQADQAAEEIRECDEELADIASAS